MLHEYLDKVIDFGNNYIDEKAKVESGAKILPNTLILGTSIIQKNAIVGPNSVIINSIISSGSEIINSFIIDSYIGFNCQIGPFAHIRNNSAINDNCRIGNYVEVKNSKISSNTKASHLSYIGDAIIGKNCNFGCGSITVNYDGKRKNKTIIGENVFIGCNCNLVAPINIGSNSLIGCGSTITEDVSSNSLSIARARQVNKVNYYSK